MKTTMLPFLLILSIFQSPAFAQEGYPLNGTWRGQWHAPGGPPDPLVVVMRYDSTGINGIVNPGRNSVPFDTAVLDPQTWDVAIGFILHTGEPVQIKGTLENIGSYKRTITGVWIQESNTYPMSITRE